MGFTEQWITNGTDRPFYARKTFDVAAKKIEKAMAYVCGLGQFNYYINGQKVSDHVLDPGWTDYRKAVQYVEFDIAPSLQPGANAAGIEVGNGWFIMDLEEGHGYSFHFPPFMPPNPNPYVPFGRSLVAAATMEITYADGSVQVIETDESWTTAPHAVAWSNVYGAEYICGARRQDGFAKAEYDDGAWTAARKAESDEAPAGTPVLQTQPPVRVIHTYTAKELAPADGKRVFDLGQNISGLLHARVRGKAGDVIRFYPAEKLDENGCPDQMAKGWMMIDSVISYEIAANDDWEDVDQVFTYFAGRYFAVEGDAEIGLLEGRAITSAWQEAGTFTCDNEKYNQIYAMIERAVEANMLSVHTDCPTIERFAWQEPNHLMGAAIMFMKDGRKLWEKFLFDMRMAQHTAEDTFRDFAGNAIPAGDGLVPSQAPCYIPNVLPVPGMGSFYDIIAWGSSIILGLRWHYLFYGDLQVVKDNYDAGVRYLNYLKTKVTEDGFINHGLGDWGNPEGVLARENVETAFLYADAKTLAWFAGLLGKKEDEAALAAYAEEVCRNYNEKLLVKDKAGRRCYRSWEKREEGIVMSQAIEALPLYWGMVPAEAEADVADALRRTIEEQGALVAGEIGLPYVIQAASAHGMDDLIAACVTKETHPSYYAFVLDGETTLGEYWEANPRSHCHDMMGHIIEWYYSGIAGIHIEEPGFKKVGITPHMPEDVNAFTCTYETPFGTIRVEGRRENGTPVYILDIPEGVENKTI